MSSPPLEIDGKPLSTAGASQLAMIWWYTAAINFKRRKKKFVSWMRSAMSSTKSINLLLYIYSIARELNNIFIFSIYHFLDKKKLEKSSNYFLVSFPWKCIYKVKWIEQLYCYGKSRERGTQTSNLLLSEYPVEFIHT
jgi:hypothetical protein